MARSAAGAESERRKLSSSFHRPINGSGVFGEPSLALSAKAENPGQQLPVAPHPAMLASRGDGVAGGKFLNHLDIGCQPRAREDAFQQIVAKDRIFRNLSFERRLEAVDFIDPLAAKGAFFEQILIDVGHRESIGIEPIGAGKGALEQRTLLPMDNDGVTRGCSMPWPCDDHTGMRIEIGLVERVRHLSDQPPGGPDRQARIRVERDDVADAGGQRRHMAIDRHERRIGGAAKQPVEFVQLAALALPADPPSFAFVPHAPAMKKEEARAIPHRPVAGVQPRDAGCCLARSAIVVGVVLRRAIPPVGDQRET